MYKGNVKEEISEIINKKNGVENKEVWIRVFQGLADYQESKFEDILKELEIENKSRNDLWCVKTGLIEKDKELDDGWSYVSDDDDYNGFENIDDRTILAKGYINCSYAEFNDICKKKYIGRVNVDGIDEEFEYSIVPVNEMILQEEKLYELADLYKISVPVIYSPMFRRYVYIECSNHIFSNNNDNINLDFDKYQLKEKVMLNCRSVWNVSEDIVSATEYRRADDSLNGETTFLKYYCDKNQYIKIDDISSDCFYKKENENITIVDKNNKASGTALKTTITTDRLSYEKIKKDYLFDGKFVANDDKLDRIYSEGDIEKVLSQFDEELGFAGICYDKDAEQVHYKKHFEYKVPNPLYYQTGATIALYFTSKNSNFNDDYIIYVINYLKRNYPEYNWKGVIKV